MALSRIKTWALGEVLTSSDLNAEFNNIIDNALSLISPLTSDLAFGGNRLTGLSAGSVSNPALQPTGDTNTGVYFSAADTVDVAAGGIRSAQFANVSSAVNYLLFTPAATAGSPVLSAAGSDTNVALKLASQAAAVIDLFTNSARQVQITSLASAVNYLTLTGATVGLGPTIASAGSDTDVNINITPKGDGVVVVDSEIQIDNSAADGAGITFASSGNTSAFIDNNAGVWRVAKSGQGLLYVTTTDPSSAETGISVVYHDTSTVDIGLVTIGATDSGGSGFRVLRVPNTH